MKVGMLVIGSFLGIQATASVSVPQVTNVAMEQLNTGRAVTITYDLDIEAVVTLDVETNADVNASSDDPGWTSIGGVAVCNATGDVWKRVDAGSRNIKWRPDQSWPDHKIAPGGARAVVTAWSLDNTPDYMVVDISNAAQQNTQRYYPGVDYLPGAQAGQTGTVTNNPLYRTSAVLMRKIMAKDVTWTMGSTPLEPGRDPGKEATHQVSLTNNYYIGVFPVTQSQWALLSAPSRVSQSWFTKDGAVRPVERVSYNEIRMQDQYSVSGATHGAAEGAQEWPGAPYEGSFLDLLRDRTGIDFDLPSEAQWEFAARAGNGDCRRGDGKGIGAVDPDANMDVFGRYKYNGGYVDSSVEPSQGCGVENGTAVVGSYAPNDWGLYDTCGNVWEYCLDWFAADISALNGAVNTAPGEYRVVRGGAWNLGTGWCRPACRNTSNPSSGHGNYSFGFRLACTAGLE